MRIKPALLPLLVLGLALLVPASGSSQEVAKRATKRAAKEATESAAKQAAEETTKKAVKKAVAPDAIDLNTASAEQLKKLGLDEETTKKVIAARPFGASRIPRSSKPFPRTCSQSWRERSTSSRRRNDVNERVPDDAVQRDGVSESLSRAACSSR